MPDLITARSLTGARELLGGLIVSVLHKDEAWENEPRDAHGKWTSGGSEEEPPPSHNILADNEIGPNPTLPDLTESYLKANPDWTQPASGPAKASYGAVIFNPAGQVLLREPTGHFGGAAWTFPKGGAEPHDESNLVSAQREVAQESGKTFNAIGHLPTGFAGTTSTTYYFLGEHRNNDPATPMDEETNALHWAGPQEAENLISQSEDPQVRDRDLAVLHAAYEQYNQIKSGNVPPPATEPPSATTMTAPATAPATTFSAVQPWNGPQDRAWTNTVIAVRSMPDVDMVLQSWDKGSSSSGSMGGAWYKDPQSGQEVLVKPADQDRAQNEALASIAYNLAGVKTPICSAQQDDQGKWWVLKSRVDGDTLPPSAWKNLPQTQAQMQRGFGADALLSNRDVHGLNADNVLIGQDGAPMRIDVGGSGPFRAMGGDKEDFNTGQPWVDPQTMRTSDQGKLAYGNMPDSRAATSLQQVQANFHPIDLKEAAEAVGIDNPNLVNRWVSTLKERIAQIPQLVKDLGGPYPLFQPQED